ncbi:hypothetical protein SJAV_01760 [Sulfurisphaera javensis]|uniref:Uncharacterized protein n=1 Tax=Sulfurisphaera javensis TaxID=2049879 RepID=A0AAT9GN31_9CREN
MKVEIHLNLLEFRNSISNYIFVENLDNGWNEIRGVEGEYFYKEFSGYAVLVSKDFPIDKGHIFERLKVDKLREILDQPGRVKYYMTLEILPEKLSTTEEDCLDEFPGIDIVNGLIKEFQYVREECCVKIVTPLLNIEKFDEALNNLIKAFQLYYSIIKMQEEVAITLARKFLAKDIK